MQDWRTKSHASARDTAAAVTELPASGLVGMGARGAGRDSGSPPAVLQTCLWRCFAAAVVGAEGAHQQFELGFEDGVVGLPAREIGGESGADLAGLAALPCE